MRVYHFLNEQYGLVALRDQRLKIAEIMELNDPLEFLCVDVSNKRHRKAINEVKSRISKKYGLLCFSENWKNPVQWAHYADGHKGLCLGFDVEDEYLKEVCYVEKRLDFPENEDLDEKFTDKLISTKYSHWKYEEEHRRFKPKEDIPKKNKINGFYFDNFSKALELKKIIIGARSKITRGDISKVLGSNKSDIKVINARAAFKSFKIVKQKKRKLCK